MTPEMQALTNAMHNQDLVFIVLFACAMLWITGSLIIRWTIRKLSGFRFATVLQLLETWVLPACFLAATVSLFALDYISKKGPL